MCGAGEVMIISIKNEIGKQGSSPGRNCYLLHTNDLAHCFLARYLHKNAWFQTCHNGQQKSVSTCAYNSPRNIILA